MYQVKVYERYRGVIGTVMLPFVPKVGESIEMNDWPIYITSVVIHCDPHNQFSYISVYGDRREWNSYR